jgi:hypothetical protein
VLFFAFLAEAFLAEAFLTEAFFAMQSSCGARHRLREGLGDQAEDLARPE